MSSEYDKKVRPTKNFQHVRLFTEIFTNDFCDMICEDYKDGQGDITNEIKDLFKYEDEVGLSTIFETLYEEYRKENDFLLRSPVEKQDMHVIRYKTGEGIPPHSSRVGTISISFVAFMNDDFQGGELYFPDNDITIKPQKGAIVFFPSTYIMPHAVAPIKDNERYVIIGGFNLK